MFVLQTVLFLGSCDVDCSCGHLIKKDFFHFFFNVPSNMEDRHPGFVGV